MRKNLEREIAAAALGSGDGREAVLWLLAKGLVAYRTARLALRNAGLDEAVTNAEGRRDYVRVGLPRGASVRLHLAPYTRRKRAGGVVGNMPLLTIVPRDGVDHPHMDAEGGARELTRRVGTNVEAVVRVVLGIERARRRLYEVCEEGTRWL